MESTVMMNESLVQQKSRKRWQYYASASACLLAVGSGTAMAWTSPVIPKLTATDSQMPVTNEQASWIGSLCAVGAIASAIPSGKMADKLGRKKSLLALSLPFLLSWLLIICASQVWLLYIARFVVGTGVGASCVLVPTYISEIAEISTKGPLSAFFQVALSMGIFIAFIFGSYLSYTWFAIVCASVIVLFLITFYRMPESPVWLMSERRKQDASVSLLALRGPKYNPGDELNEMQKVVEETAGKETTLLDMMKSVVARKALLASLGMMFFQQASGINAVIFYTVVIFQASGSSLKPEIASIIVASVQLVMSLFAAGIVDRAGRKLLLIISCSIMSVSLVALGYYFKQKNSECDVSSLGWLPLTSMIVFMVVFSIGLGPVPWMLMGELFSSETKAKASSIAVLLNWFMVFLVTKTFPVMNEELGIDVTFWIFAAIMAAGTGFTQFFVPETKGKSYQEIAIELEGNTSSESIA